MSTDEEPDIVLTHLLAAWTELEDERTRVAAQLKRIDDQKHRLTLMLLADYNKSEAAKKAMVNAGVSLELDTGDTELAPPAEPVAAPPVKDAIVALLGHRGPMATADIAPLLAGHYHWAESSVRSQLARMAREGDLYKAKRGWYSLEPIVEVDVQMDLIDKGPDRNAEAPADTGASEGSTVKEVELV